MKTSEIILITSALLFAITLSTGIIGIPAYNILTGYDIEVEQPFVDGNGDEFIDEMCTVEIHCGKITQKHDERCSQNTRKVSE